MYTSTLIIESEAERGGLVFAEKQQLVWSNRVHKTAWKSTFFLSLRENISILSSGVTYSNKEQ